MTGRLSQLMHGIGYVAGLIALAVAALALGVRWVPLTHLVLLAMAAAPYLTLGAPADRLVEPVPARRGVAGETLEHGHGRRRRPVADPGVRFDPVVASVHVISPPAPDGKWFDDWRGGITAIRAVLDGSASAGPGSVIVAADFIITPDLRR